ncbi:C40 family peptidase [candidate division KSB1 bacterium]|nr:C40 family peptidase [candidate division KSB1 bacterium]
MNRYNLFFLLLFLFSLTAFGQDQSALEEVTAIIDQVDKELAPDHRLDLFQISETLSGDTLLISGETTMPAVRDTLLSRLGRSFSYYLQDEIQLLPDESIGNQPRGVITISTAQLRRGPDVDHEIINQGILGETVRIYKRRGMFWLIKLSDGYLGYMMGSSIEPMNNDQYAQWRMQPKLMYMNKVGDIYSDKSEKSLPVSDIVLTAVVALEKKEGKWLRVRLPDGRGGYLRKSTVIEMGKFRQQGKPKPQQLVRLARQFMGYPYLWGGLSPKGFDCSGFTRTIYKLHGIALPRDANMQVKSGVEVPFDSTFHSLQTGDLLFFGRRPERITHVAMYIGDYQFIHSDGMVRINSFNPDDEGYSAYRVKYLQAVRRIL